MSALRIGTCSWKYDSWRGIVYSANPKLNYLQEYSTRYNTVEIDQWFWSLFDDIVRLPEERTVKEYNDLVPDDFKFTIKVPNSITLTNYYSYKNNLPLKRNPDFLSPALFSKFLKTIRPMQKKIGSLMFQFEYLNKQKIESQSELLEKLCYLFERTGKEYHYSLELRNPNYLNKTYFSFLNEHKLGHVLLQGYYMPTIKEVFQKFKEDINGTLIIRLVGPDRKKIEEITGGDWSKIVLPKDEKISWIPPIIYYFQNQGTDIFLNVNNHFEGSAPLTIKKIRALLNNS
jgi:uncharacterized protein YecE (DUF72 family)